MATHSTPLIPGHTDERRPALARLAIAGGATAMVAAIANVLIRSVGVAAGTVPSDYVMLKPALVAGASTFGIVLATVLLAALVHVRSRPVRLFRTIVAIGAVLSLGSPLMAAAGQMQGMPTPSTSTAVTMMVMHGIAAAAAAFVLPALAWRGVAGPQHPRVRSV